MTQKYPYHIKLNRTFSNKLIIYLTIYTVLIITLVLLIVRMLFID